jgi:hypothetical protein
MKVDTYYLGVDLGQSQDYTAITLLEYHQDYNVGTHQYELEYKVSHIERCPLNTEYPLIVEKIVRLFDEPRLKQYGKLLVDETGVGRPVVDMMTAQGLYPIPITITSGAGVTETDQGFHVPKKELITSLLILFQSGQLKIIKSLPFTDTLVVELENFRAKISLRTGNETFGAWRERDHDDLVLALSMCTWQARRDALVLEHQIWNASHNMIKEGSDGWDPLRWDLED